MARKPSVILTPAEKKELVKTIKTDLKTTSSTLKDAKSRRKQLEKDHAAALKASDRELAQLERDINDKTVNIEKLTAPTGPMAVPRVEAVADLSQ